MRICPAARAPAPSAPALCHRRLLLALAAASGLALLAPGAHAATVTPGFEADATLKGAVRYFNFGNSGPGGQREVQIGTSSGGGVGSAADGHVTWSASNTVTFTYAPNTLSTTTKSAPTR